MTRDEAAGRRRTSARFAASRDAIRLLRDAAEVRSGDSRTGRDAHLRTAGSGPVEKPGAYILQAGSFRNHADADRVRALIAMQGVESKIQKVTIDKDTWHRVRVGTDHEPAETRRHAKQTTAGAHRCAGDSGRGIEQEKSRKDRKKEDQWSEMHRMSTIVRLPCLPRFYSLLFCGLSRLLDSLVFSELPEVHAERA